MSCISKSFTAILSLLIALVAANAAPARAEIIKYGPAKPLGDGSLRSFVKLSGKSGRPLAIGVSLTAATLRNLPTERDFYVVDLALPAGVSIPPYDHLGIDWNPHGHPPLEIYGAPHFDFHFYFIDLATRYAITCSGPDAAVCLKPVPAAYIPPFYIPNGAVPEMGWHWIDSRTPELNGAPFTKTFIYGYYNGLQAFIEPMITLDTIRNARHECSPIEQPEAVNRTGWYPRRYCIDYHAKRGEYRITLDRLVYRTATASGGL